MHKPGIDKRIAIFALFAVPVILVAAISYYAGSQSVTSNSKASEMKSQEIISPTPATTQQFTCLVPREVASSKTVELYAEKSNAYIQSQPVQIYAVGPVTIQYLSLVEIIPAGNMPLTSIRESLLDKGALTRFVGIQGDTSAMSVAGSSMQQQAMAAARQCQSLVLE